MPYGSLENRTTIPDKIFRKNVKDTEKKLKDTEKSKIYSPPSPTFNVEAGRCLQVLWWLFPVHNIVMEGGIIYQILQNTVFAKIFCPGLSDFSKFKNAYILGTL